MWYRGPLVVDRAWGQFLKKGFCHYFPPGPQLPSQPLRGRATTNFVAFVVKVAHTWLPSVGFRSWSRFLAVSLQVTWIIKLGGRLPLLSARSAVTLATLKRPGYYQFRCLVNRGTMAQWVWTVCLRLLPHSVAAAIWTQALLRLSLAR